MHCKHDVQVFSKHHRTMFLSKHRLNIAPLRIGNQKTLIRRRRQKKDFHSKNFNFSPFWSIFGKQFRRFSFMRGLFCPNNFSREYRGGNPLNDIKSASDILRQKYAHGRMAEIPNCKKPPMAFTKKFRLRQKFSAQTYAISSHF